MIDVKDIYRSFGEREVLRGVSFTLPDGVIAGLIGPSGGGKSVLLKILGGVIESTAGSITGQGTGNHEISLMFQEGALFDSLTVFDNVAFPLVDGKVPVNLLPARIRNEVEHTVSEILSRVGLTQAALKMPSQLSGGMRRRVSLARALVTKPRLVLLDDPTAGLDPVASRIIMNLIVELHGVYNPTMVMVSQDLRRLLPVVQHIFALFEGRIIFDGTLQELEKTDDRTLYNFVSCRYDFGGDTAPSAAQGQR